MRVLGLFSRLFGTSAPADPRSVAGRSCLFEAVTPGGTPGRRVWAVSKEAAAAHLAEAYPDEKVQAIRFIK